MKKNYYENLLQKRTGKALSDYRMIEKDDKVLIGVSGVDSMSLLEILLKKARYFPIKFNLIAVHITMNKKNSSVIEEYLRSKDIEYHILPIDLKDKRKDIKKQGCFWCSWKRREILFKLANKLNCQKLALAHHLDDTLETLFLNMFYQGEISTMPPRVDMFKGKFSIIRPFSYIEKKDILEFAKIKSLPPIPNTCKVSKTSKRLDARKLIKDVSSKHPNIKENIFKSMSNVKKDYLPIKGIGEK